LSLNASTTLTLINQPLVTGAAINLGYELTFVVNQNATGGWVLTLPSNFVPSGTQPALNAAPYTTANAFYVVKAVLDSINATANWIYWVE